MVERPQSPTPVVVGMVLLQRWRLDGSLGAGGMAEVFRATDLHTGRGVAVKVLRGSLESSPEAIQRFRREGELLVRLKNPAIVGAETIASLPDGRLYIVMELLEGETLGARLKRGPMSTSELGPVVAGCAVALAAAHAAGIVHRDLKPDNVFLARVPDGSVQVKLLDFGVSKVFNGEKLTQTGQVLGTPRYMSPEQLGAEPEVDHRVDLYSLGVILYEALSGRSPFLASTPTDLIVSILHGKTVPLRSVRPDVPPAVEAVVMRAMAKLRDARHRAATELAEAYFEAAGIDARVRPAARHGMATTPLGAMRAAADGSPLAEVAPGAGADTESGALKVGTFSSFEAIDLSRVLGAHATAPAPVGVAAQVGAVTAPGPSEGERAAIAVAATAYAPGGFKNAGPTLAAEPTPPRREIPMTALSPVMPGIGAGPAETDASTAARDPHGATRREPSGQRAHEAQPDAYPGRISRSSSASLAGGRAPRAAPAEAPRSPGGLLLVGVGLLAGALTAGVVVAVLTWVTQMSASGGRTPPPPPPAALTDAAAAPDAGASSGAAAAAATGAVVPGASGGGSATASDGEATAVPAGGGSASGEPAAPTGSPGASAGSAGSTASSTGGATPASSGSGSSATTSAGGRSPSTGGSTGTTSPAGSSRSSGAASGSGGGDDSPGAVASDEAASSAASTLAEATRALARGDFEECVDILDDVIARGGTPVALRRRGDCLLRMGEVREATRDYQRFCRLAPDHPAISEVRGILSGMGATCP